MTVRYFENYGKKNVSVSSSIAAQNTFGEAIEFAQDKPFNVSVSGTFSATVWLQRSFDAGSTWVDVESYTSPSEKLCQTTEDGVLWRLGVKTGGYTSGTAVCRLSQ